MHWRHSESWLRKRRLLLSTSLPPTGAVGAQPEHWDTVISPRAGWLDWRLGEIWSHRDLLQILVWRDFAAVHKQTVLGPLWHIVNPILTALTYTLIFGRVIKVPTDGLPPILFFMGGTIAWNYFISCFFKTSNALTGNAGLFGKVYFHRLVVPLSAVLSSLISFGIQSAIFAVMIAGFRMTGVPVRPGLWILAMPLLVAMLAGFGLSIGLIASAATARYRDVAHVISFMSQLLMFATPIIYPLSAVSEPLKSVIRMNPLTPIVETFRYATLGRGSLEPLSLLGSAFVLVILLAIGISLFTKAERTFLDTA